MGEFLSSLWPLGATILVILGAAVLVALIVVLVRVAKTMKNVNVITQEAEEQVAPALKRVDPLLDRVELTVDTANLELLRVDAILEDVESVTDVAGKAADTVSTVTTAPSEAVTSVVERVRGAFIGHRKNKAKEKRVVYPIATSADGKHSVGATKAKPAAAKATADRPQAEPAAEPASDAPTYEELKAAAQSAAAEISGDDSKAAPSTSENSDAE